ncbi:uncharacterized protein EV420DRAFT_1477726 [Desarmillaria tabescens]|uniref:BTB domain-containing protein n=1 Tax=Armillaria tabescens TaxID=1929756 RepID=A0AA39TKA1_ARMTA|nr:uncharacterized protein EV420DRAFT_1477726 [Desarmillaria tabescens]KAK0462042.1 hypothetical protein EV420DRAFT_1477726 [Desarmillaria tabescens]
MLLRNEDVRRSSEASRAFRRRKQQSDHHSVLEEWRKEFQNATRVKEGETTCGGPEIHVLDRATVSTWIFLSSSTLTGYLLPPPFLSRAPYNLPRFSFLSFPLFKLLHIPFDGADSTSDLSLVSSDGMKFFIHEAILSYVSQFFKDMFTLPQATPGESSISMAEDSKTVDKILRSVIPLTELSQVVMVMIKKFLMDDVAKKARDQLLSHTESEPLRVFAIVYAIQWSREANDAANAALAVGSTIFYVYNIPELDFVPGTVLYDLFEVQDRRHQSLQDSANPETYSHAFRTIFLVVATYTMSLLVDYPISLELEHALFEPSLSVAIVLKDMSQR